LEGKLGIPFPSAGIIRIRFKGYFLSFIFEAPPTVQSEFMIVLCGNQYDFIELLHLEPENGIPTFFTLLWSGGHFF